MNAPRWIARLPITHGLRCSRFWIKRPAGMEMMIARRAGIEDKSAISELLAPRRSAKAALKLAAEARNEAQKISMIRNQAFLSSGRCIFKPKRRIIRLGIISIHYSKGRRDRFYQLGVKSTISQERNMTNDKDFTPFISAPVSYAVSRQYPRRLPGLSRPRCQPLPWNRLRRHRRRQPNLSCWRKDWISLKVPLLTRRATCGARKLGRERW